ncbi:hypothetical protein FNV43_RR01640 [Rhamnella rubrinervis]|uniref:H(+)-transporting two-sector ATPase n=1 Tax=Rhamnella rubrinervis TaxID=2594499 RepID=A0A8K0MT61_9ROSA|nr:hypothetical protein FNV43_RR01640 [Rhamnella rubrinervis]
MELIDNVAKPQGGVSTFGGVGECTHEGNDLYMETKEYGVINEQNIEESKLDLKYRTCWVECLLSWVINPPFVPKWVRYKKELLLPKRDDLTDPAPATAFVHLDATIVLSRGLIAKDIYPARDPLDSTSTMLQPWIVGEEHYETT